MSPRNTANSSWRRILLTSVGVTILVLGVRSLKWLQPWELSAYDQMLRLRPPEAVDPRILIVTISGLDLQRENWPLSDGTIHQMLTKLQSYHPRVIGLNIYQPQKHLAVGKVRENIIGVCKLSSIGDPEVAPPSISMDNVGFNNLVADDDGIIRRSLLFAHAKKDKQCATSYSFAALLAINYLKKQGIQPSSLNKKDFYLGKTFFRTLRKNSGSYEQISANGHQILLNYHNPNRLAKQVTLSQLLSDRVNPSLVKDKLVIIGTTSSGVQPSFYTPYSASPIQPAVMPAVFIQTQTVSQILSTVLDGRPLIWYWSDGVEAVWVWVWSLAGGVLAWRLRHPLYLGLAGAASIAGLVGVCFVLFLQAGWVPVVPSMLAFILSLFSIMAYTTYRTQQHTKLITLQVEKQLEAIAQLNILLKEDTETQRSRNAENSANFSPDSPSPLLSQRYKLTKVLAQGGFGCTYLAEDTQRPGNPICVVKQLMPARRDPRFLQVARRLFDAEANILEALGTHEQIPELLAFFEENNQFYLVQEYIQGQLLSEKLAPGGKQNESFVKDMLLGILEVLAFVHEHRVIHRDIKPSNIIRRALDNRLVLIDFGAVKQMQPLNTEQTELATVAIGTRGYSPPEQFVGHPRLSSDIYAVGMIGIQALTGIPPQELQQNADTGTVLWRELAQISPELAVILDKMVCYHFSDRYQSAAAALQDLRQM
ncbi:MAG: CHASE2 domain-containing serine/threonine-protein kinase [Rhizonema sp. NSF051]|nr:CHASE2 domain-containing serine/threonine-protein kinase [Rhizonema sp. NSF051]